MLTWIALTILALCILFTICTRFTRTSRMLDRLPGPISYPIIGNIFYTFLNPEGLFKLLREKNKEYYPIYRFWIMHICSVNILIPDHIEAIISNSKEIQKSESYKLLKPWLGTGLVVSNGEKWQTRRRILTPAFHYDMLKHFFHTMYENSQHLIETLKEEAQGGPIVKNMNEILGDFALNVICETAMGISIKDKNAAYVKYLEGVKEVSSFITYRFLRPWYHYDFIFNLSRYGRVQKKSLKAMNAFTESIIAERKRYHESTDRKYLKNFSTMNEKSTDSDTENYVNRNNVSVRKRRLAVLDLLIAVLLETNEIDEEGIREEVATFTFGGHDTISLSMSFSLLLFAKHQDIQKRAREEVDRVMREANGQLTITDLHKLSYLERCMKESARLYPSIPLVSRKLINDCHLDGYTVPAGAMCHIHIYEAHRNPDYWPNPLVYDPDRFLPENVMNRHPCAYIPFSGGLRSCMGQKYAMMEMKLVLASILHNFALEPALELDDVPLQLDMVLRPSCPLKVTLVPLH